MDIPYNKKEQIAMQVANEMVTRARAAAFLHGSTVDQANKIAREKAENLAKKMRQDLMAASGDKTLTVTVTNL